MGNIVMFPAHKVKKPKIKQTEEQSKKIKENIFIEQLVEEFTLDFIHVLQENAVDIKGETMLRDLAVVIESSIFTNASSHNCFTSTCSVWTILFVDECDVGFILQKTF